MWEGDRGDKEDGGQGGGMSERRRGRKKKEGWVKRERIEGKNVTKKKLIPSTGVVI